VSGGGWKEPFYAVAKNDSRNAAWLGNAIGWQGLEDEGKYNTKNPGHAVTKAAEYAAMYYLGGQIGQYLGGGSQAAPAAGAVVDESAGLAMNAGTTTAQQAAQQQAMQAALSSGDESLGLLGANYSAPVSDLSVMANGGAPVADRSVQAGLLDKTRLAFTSGGNTGKGGQLAAQYGLKMMQPDQQPQPMAPPPRQQGPMEPLPRSYNSGPYGTSAGNSMGLLTPEEERKRRMMMMGRYQ
jgi:hypothetical protein